MEKNLLRLQRQKVKLTDKVEDISEMGKTTIGDIIILQRGFDITKNTQNEGAFPVISSSGINSYHNEYKVKGPGVIIGRKGTLGTAFYSKTDFWPHDTTLWVKDFKENDPLFIFYLLKKLPLKKLDSGSANPTLNRNFVHKISINIPELAIQQKIASILSALDEKIELNNKINAELEGMAKLIYDYWFVQFDFPYDFAQSKSADETSDPKDVKPYKSSGGKMVWNGELKREVPEGWVVANLGKHIGFQRGISYTKKDLSSLGVPMISLNSFNLDGTYKNDGIKSYSGKYQEKNIVKQGDLLIAVTDVTRSADIIGKAILVPHYLNEDLVISMDVAKVTSKILPPSYLMFLFNSNHYHNYIKWYASGTLVLHLNLDGINRYTSEIPSKGLLDNFEKFYNPISTKISENTKQNQELSALRDWLLPMLMNGQVRVEGKYEVEIGMAAEPKEKYN